MTNPNVQIVDTQVFVPKRFQFVFDEETQTILCQEVQLPEQASTQYRHTIFQALYGNPNDVAILDCSGIIELGVDVVSDALTTKLPDGWYLDGATGSRKKGIVFITNNPERAYSSLYLSDSKRISHYSMLWSENHCIVKLSNLRLVVLDDEVFENQVQWGMADCHGIMSQHLHTSIFSHINDELEKPLSEHGMIQYRLAQKAESNTVGWVAKGTVLNIEQELIYNDHSVDLILPKSSFKAYCPELGEVMEYDAEHSLYFGIYKVSKPSKYSTSHSVLGWFKSKAAKQSIKKLATQAMEKLVEKRKDVKSLARHYLDTVAGTQDGEVWGDESQQAEQQAKLETFTYARILAKDTYNQLALHPKTRDWANKVTANMCKDIALGSFLSATGLMLSSCPFLIGDTAISHDLQTGTYIYWRYPLRCYTDIFKVTVINAKDLLDYPDQYSQFFSDPSLIHSFYLQSCLNTYTRGVAWISPSVAKKCAGDFDGKLIAA